MANVRQIAVLLLLLAASITLAAAQEASVSALSEGVPDDYSPAVQAAVTDKGYEVKLDGSPVARVWFTSGLTLAASGSTELGVSFGQLEQGSFVGIIQLLEPWKDYKDSTIPAGHYTLRYGVQPADGNHMGVSYYRDFLLFGPAEQDTDPEKTYSYGELVAFGVQASGTPHPAVMALFPLYEEVTEPEMVKNDLDQWTLAVPFDSITLGLVVQGHGEIEGY